MYVYCLGERSLKAMFSSFFHFSLTVLPIHIYYIYVYDIIIYMPLYTARDV